MFCFKRKRKPLLCGAIAVMIAVSALFGACSGTESGDQGSETSHTVRSSSVPDAGSAAGGSEASSAADPATLEQELLARRGIPFESSDYKKFICDDGIIDINSEFDFNVDHGYSIGINEIVVSGGRVYFANLNTTLANGMNVMEAGVLPESGSVLYWHYTYDGEMGSMYFRSGNGYKVSCSPLSSSPLDPAHDPLFEKVYLYASDGKTLEDHTSEFLNSEKVYDTGRPTTVFAGGKVFVLFPAEYLDPDTGEWNWYRSMGRRQYIAFELDISAAGGEKPVRLFNENILMTDNAPENWAIFKDVHEPIIARDDFEKVQTLISKTKRRAPKPKNGEKSIFCDLLFCGDCHGKLRHHTNTINKDIHYFVCSNNKVDYRGECPGRHYVRADAIEQVVMLELHRMAEFLESDEEAFAELLAQKTDKELLKEKKHDEEELQKAIVRNDTVSNLYEKLYEDNATGKVSDEWFMQLSHKYEVERLELKAKIKTLRQKLSECGQCERDRDTFISAIRRFMRMDRLTAPLLRELIDHIDVFETEGTGKSRTQRIVIYYRFVGYVEIPEVSQRQHIKADTRKGVAVEYLTEPLTA